MSTTQYHAQRAANNFTLQHAVADSVDGVSPEDVTDITVVEQAGQISTTTSSSSHLRRVSNISGEAATRPGAHTQGAQGAAHRRAGVRAAAERH